MERRSLPKCKRLTLGTHSVDTKSVAQPLTWYFIGDPKYIMLMAMVIPSYSHLWLVVYRFTIYIKPMKSANIHHLSGFTAGLVRRTTVAMVLKKRGIARWKTESPGQHPAGSLANPNESNLRLLRPLRPHGPSSGQRRTSATGGGESCAWLIRPSTLGCSGSG